MFCKNARYQRKKHYIRLFIYVERSVRLSYQSNRGPSSMNHQLYQLYNDPISYNHRCKHIIHYAGFILLIMLHVMACSEDDSQQNTQQDPSSTDEALAGQISGTDETVAGQMETMNEHMMNSNGGDEAMDSNAITYYQHVRPILETHCTQCHRPQGVGLFDLSTYESAKMWSTAVVEATQSRRMPPWGAYNSEDCTPRFDWQDDNSLSEQELDWLVQWQEQGQLEGDETQATPFNPPSVVTLDRIDFEGSAQFPIEVEAGSDAFICVVIDPQVVEETWIKGIEIVPDNEELVHHVVLFTDPTQASLELAREDGTYPCFGSAGVPGSIAAAWAPGAKPAYYPADHAMRVAPGTLFVMQMHYSPQGGASELSDQTHLRFEYADQSPLYEVYFQLMGNFGYSFHPGLGLISGDFNIPAGAQDHLERMRWTYTGQLFGGPNTEGPGGLKEMRILSIAPHMHYAGVEMQVKLDRVAEGAKACQSGQLLELFGCGNQYGCLEKEDSFTCLETECTEQWDALALNCWGCLHNALANNRSAGQDRLFAEMLKCEQPKLASESPLIQSEQPPQECLVNVTNYDFEWQRSYSYDASLEELPILSPGDVMTIDCYYNNSMDNRLMREALGRVGLDTPQEIKLGDETLDEMCLVALLFAFERNDL